MISYVYIDNYKCFVGFECELQSLQLILGDNGAGKTSVFDVIETLRDFISIGVESAKSFPNSTRTAWDTRTEQTFELGIRGNGGEYRYRLVIEHDRAGARNRVKTERLEFDGNRLYEFDGSDAHLFRDTGTAGPTFPFDWSRSAIATIPERPDNQKLTWFRKRLSRVYVFSPDPPRMVARSESELEKPDRPLHELVSWLRHLAQESVDTIPRLRNCLQQEVMTDLTNMRLEKVTDTTRMLKFDFKFEGGNEKPFTLPFDQLSEGQRNLVALFAIAYATVSGDATVCIDEPDNFVALREIQPWLTLLRDRVADEHGQCLLISHHPEIINYLAAKHGLLVYRDESGPGRAKPFEWKEGGAMLPAELMARGWE